MGRLIELSAYQTRHRPVYQPTAGAARFFFDLSCPFSYMASERVEATFTRVEWVPASAAALGRGPLTPEGREQARAAAELRAGALRLPLVWPELWPAGVPRAMRAASYAAEVGRGAAFALAAGRLAFCGGFDLDDPEILAEAAAAAGVGLDPTLEAARDPRWDAGIEQEGKRLLAVGADRLPALRVGHALVCGEPRISALLTAGGAAAALVT